MSPHCITLLRLGQELHISLVVFKQLSKHLDVSVECCLVQHAVLAHLKKNTASGWKRRCPSLTWGMYTYTVIYIYGYSLIESSLQCLRTCHRIHRSCPRLQEVVHVSHAPLITFVFNCCGMDGSHWGLLTRLSRIWVYIYNMYRIHTCTWIHRCICLYMYVHVCTCMYMYFFVVCMCLCICICICKCICICICTCTCIVYVKSLWMGRTPWLGDCLQLIGEALINQWIVTWHTHMYSYRFTHS